jgi:hypothetical protein
MSNKRKRAKLEADRQKKLSEAGPLVNGIAIPEGVIAADLTKQAPNNSYSPPLYYVDRSFTCVDCGSEEVWTAEQQQWYYEVAKGPIQAQAIRCRDCRKVRRTLQEKSRAGLKQSPK